VPITAKVMHIMHMNRPILGSSHRLAKSAVTTASFHSVTGSRGRQRRSSSIESHTQRVRSWEVATTHMAPFKHLSGGPTCTNQNAVFIT